MRLSKLFLSSLLAQTLVSGCIHLGGASTSGGFATNNSNQNAVLAIFNSGKSDAEVSKDLKSYFCSGTKARRNLTQNIVAKMPAFKDKNLEIVQNQKETLWKEYEALAANYFSVTGIPADDCTEPRNAAKRIDCPYSKVISISGESPKTYDSKIKEIKYDPKDQSQAVFYKYHFVAFPDKNMVYLVPEKIWGVAEYENNLELQRWDIYASKKKSDLTLQMESSALVSHFGLLGPKVVTGNSGNLVRNATDRRVDLWKRYFEEFTTVKKSPGTKEPDDFNFQVTVDLEGFCQHGKSIEELTAK